AHRVKLKIVGREKDLAKINRTALAIARKVARATGTLLAGDICNTSIYGIDDASSHRQARRIFDEQIGWAVDAGVDFIVGETDPHGISGPDGRPFPTALDPFLCSRYEIAEFGTEASALGVRYLGVCCGAGPHHVRSLAEALGRRPPASRFSPDMSKHILFGTD